MKNSLMLLEQGHELAHQLRIGSGERALMIVHSRGVGHGAQHGIQFVWPDFAEDMPGRSSCTLRAFRSPAIPWGDAASPGSRGGAPPGRFPWNADDWEERRGSGDSADEKMASTAPGSPATSSRMIASRGPADRSGEKDAPLDGSWKFALSAEAIAMQILILSQPTSEKDRTAQARQNKNRAHLRRNTGDTADSRTRLSSLFRGRWRVQQVKGFTKDRIVGGEGLWSRRRFLLGTVVVAAESSPSSPSSLKLRSRVNNFGGSDTFFQNGLAVRIVVIRHGKNDRRAVVQGNQFLLGRQAESALADDVAALGVSKRGRQNFTWPGRGDRK